MAHNTSLNPPLFIEVLVQARKESRHVFELKDISLASLYRFSIVFSGNVPTVRPVSFFILLSTLVPAQTEMSATVLTDIDYGISIRTVGIN